MQNTLLNWSDRADFYNDLSSASEKLWQVKIFLKIRDYPFNLKGMVGDDYGFYFASCRENFFFYIYICIVIVPIHIFFCQ